MQVTHNPTATPGTHNYTIKQFNKVVVNITGSRKRKGRF